MFSKRQYKAITGKEERNDVIAYQVRQSFKPGEVTPEEANQIGYDFASRFLKGKHAFIVNYSKTRDVYVAYRKSGYSKKFLAEHEDDIIIHKAAKKAFDEMGVKKLPTIKSFHSAPP